MDGTLLPGSKVPNPVDLEALREFKTAGGLFSVATGRILQSVSKYFDSFKPNAPVILTNGGALYDVERQTMVFSEYLPESAYDMTKTVMEKFPKIGIEIDTEEMVYAVSESETEDRHIKLSYIDGEYVKTSVSDIPSERKWLKVLFAAEPEEIDELICHIKSIGYDGADFIRSSGVYYEMLPKNCSKGNALKKMLDLYGLRDYTVVAAGDYHNDIDMLEAADIAVAPRNALDCVKDVADYVTDASCDDGFFAEAVGYIMDELTELNGRDYL
jgi:Cof subfamily protein (haloacid dehalogenase superfamily)